MYDQNNIARTCICISQGETGTRIQFQPEEKGSKVRGCYVTGPLEGVLRAQQIVLGICRKEWIRIAIDPCKLNK